MGHVALRLKTEHCRPFYARVRAALKHILEPTNVDVLQAITNGRMQEALKLKRSIPNPTDEDVERACEELVAYMSR